MHKNLIAIAVFLGCVNAHAITIKSSDYGKTWPFTVEYGDLKCVNKVAVVFNANDIDYAVNGIASAMKYKRIDEIWRQDPDTQTRINIRPIIERGLSLCGIDTQQ